MWHYAVDQYDTFTLARWYEENYYDEGGTGSTTEVSIEI